MLTTTQVGLLLYGASEFGDFAVSVRSKFSGARVEDLRVPEFRCDAFWRGGGLGFRV